MQAFAVVLALIFAACGGEGEPPRRDAPGEGIDTTVTRVEAATDERAEDPSPRVVFLGTSLTAGLGVDDPADRWPELLGEMADSAGYPIEVVNAGVSGDTSAGGLRRLEWLLADPVQVLIVELGANDGLRGQSPEAMQENLTTIIGQTRKAWPDARIVLAGMEAPPNLGAEYTEAFRAVFPRVADATGAVLIPFLLEGVAGVAELNQADGIHPTPRGHRAIAHTVWPYLQPILSDLHSEGVTP